MLIRMIQAAGKTYQLSPADMLKLQNAGVSDNVVQAMMDPRPAAPTSTRAAVPPVAVSEKSAAASADVTPFPPDLPNIQKGVRKRRLAVLPFNYAAVATWVQYWFHNDVNIGQGIQAMLTARMGQAKNVVLVERGQTDALLKELNLNNKSGLVNQGTRVKTGKFSGADCILMGDIVIFGRDDKSESGHDSGYGQVGRMLGNRMGFGRQISAIGTFSKEEKAVVGIALWIVDTETSEVLETAEAKGESSRSSKNWSAFTAGSGTYQSNSGAMESSNFQATIIGEATSAAVDKIIALLDDRVPQMPLRARTVEGRVAKISGNTPILAFGSNEGLAVGDRLDILKIVSEVKDPATQQVLDAETVKVGEMVVSSVREQIATGNYGGQKLLENWDKGYTARLVVR